MEIDKLDKDILNLLIDDSRLSYREMARKTKVAVATIMNRVNKLEKERIIKRYSAVIDYEKLDYDVEVLVEVRISKGKLFEVEGKIAIDPNVFGVYDITGDFDCVILARFQSRRSMDAFLKKIQKFDFVERTRTTMILHTIREKEVKL